MCLCHRIRRWISKIDGCLNSAFVFCMRNFSLCEGTVPDFFVILILVLTTVTLQTQQQLYVEWPYDISKVVPSTHGRLIVPQDCPGNEVGCLCMLPIHHTAGTQTHKILLLFSWLGGSKLPVNIFHAAFRKPTESAYVHWRHLPDNANLLPQAPDEHGGWNSSDGVTPDGDHKLEGESEFMNITHGLQCGFETPSSTNSRKKPKVDWPQSSLLFPCMKTSSWQSCNCSFSKKAAVCPCECAEPDVKELTHV